MFLIKPVPDAVVILMERENPEAWLDSFVRMIKYFKAGLYMVASPPPSAPGDRGMISRLFT